MSAVLDTIQQACDDVNSFKEQLRDRRKDRGWTQGALAMHLNRATSYVSDLENMDKPLPPSFLLSDAIEIINALGLQGAGRTRMIDAYFCAALIRLINQGNVNQGEQR